MLMMLKSVAFVDDLPPILQVGLVVFLGAFSLLSLAARTWPALGRRIWDPEREPDSFQHLLGYTLVPLVFFLAALFAVQNGWDPGRPWLDGMTPAMAWSVAGIALALVLVVAAQILKKRLDLTVANQLSAWIPFLLILAAIALMVISTFRLAREL